MLIYGIFNNLDKNITYVYISFSLAEEWFWNFPKYRDEIIYGFNQKNP